jgi:peptide/nickel transport system permease protein
MNKYLWKISLIVFFITGVFAGFIANDKPILCKDNNGFRIPVLERNNNYIAGENCKILINPLIKYSYKSIDTKNAGFISPFSKQNLKNGQQRHYLGTDQIGRDVLAGMIHGTGIALKVGTFTMALALLLALILSVVPSYYGDNDFKLTWAKTMVLILTVLAVIYLLININLFLSFSLFDIALTIFFMILILAGIFYLIKTIPVFRNEVAIPLDSQISIFTKLFQSLPGTFIVLILISLFSQASIYNIILVIAILKWPLISRYIRAEILKIKEERFIEASKTLGLKDQIVIVRHILPHIWTPVIVALSFGFAGTILLESTLSFLGIGIPADHVSWGSLLNQARQNYSAWWLAVFPGLAIFWIIYTFNEIGNSISDKIEGEK